MIWLRQAVQRQHAKYSRQTCAQHRALKRNGNKCRPGMEWLAAHIDGVGDCRYPVFQRISANHAEHGADQHDQRDTIMVCADGFRGFFQRIRCVCIHFAVAGGVSALGCFHQLRGRLEFRHQSVNRSSCHYSFTFACGISVRISKMEMAGMSRIKIKKSKVKNPMVPTKIIMSHLVNKYMPHELGRKSRWRFMTTITKRSSHIPVLTTMATRKSFQGVERTLLNQS